MVSKGLIIFIDTNKLGDYQKGSLVSKNFNYLSIGKDIFLSLINFLQNNRTSLGDIKLVIPKMATEELIEQQVRSFSSELNKLKTCFSKFETIEGFKLESSNIDYKKHLKEKMSAFVSKYKIEILDYPDDSVFRKLLEKVISRKKPFYKKQNNKDSGFKDAIIWESILNYAQNNKDDNDFLFFSADDDFNHQELLEEFHRIIKKPLKILDNLPNVKEYLDNRGNLQLNLKLINEEYNIEVSKQLNLILENSFYYIRIDEVDFKILNFCANHAPFDLEIIDKNKYRVSVALAVDHETPYTGYDVVDEHLRYYQTDCTVGSARLTIQRGEDGKITLSKIDFEDLNLVGNFPEDVPLN